MLTGSLQCSLEESAKGGRVVQVTAAGGSLKDEFGHQEEEAGEGRGND